MNRDTSDRNRFENKCSKCGTWSVDKDFSFDMCMDGEERNFKNYWCVNCGDLKSVSDENVFDTIEDGDTVFF